MVDGMEFRFTEIWLQINIRTSHYVSDVCTYLNLMTKGADICLIRGFGHPMTPSVTQSFVRLDTLSVLVLQAEICIDGKNESVQPAVKFGQHGARKRLNVCIPNIFRGCLPTLRKVLVWMRTSWALNSTVPAFSRINTLRVMAPPGSLDELKVTPNAHGIKEAVITIL
jgi:hypothetical protein